MKTYKLDPSSFEKFIHQNGADLVEFYEGSLLDNYLYETKHGATMAIYETYQNANSSIFTVFFAKDKREARLLKDEFIYNQKRLEAELAEF